MRIYFVNRYFYPDHSATSQMLTELTFALARRGHEITVLTSRLSYDDPAVRYPSREVVGGVEVIRLATTGFGRAGLAGRAVDYTTFYLSTAWKLLSMARRGDLIVAKTDPPLLSIVTTPIAHLRGARAINWLQDIFPEVATKIGLGRMGITRAAFSVLRWGRDRALRKAALNIAIGERMASVLRGLGVSSNSIRVIPNWADGGLVRPVEPSANGLRRAWGLENALVIGYSGNLGRAHDTSTILKAIELTQAECSTRADTLRKAMDPGLKSAPIIWLFVGGGAQFANLRAESGRQDFSNVHFHPYQPRDKLAESLSVPDIHLISLKPDLEGLIVPSKYYGVAAAGRPAIFIGDPEGEIGRILTESATGFVVSEGDANGLAQAIRKLADAPQLREEMGRRARVLFDARYDARFAVDLWENVISRSE